MTFDLLKHAFTTAPVLHPDPTKPFHVEMDVANFSIETILSQPDEVGVLHLVAYYSHKFTAPKINYTIYDKDLLAIVVAFEEWRCYLAGTQHPIQVVTYNKNLIYFSTTQTLNCRQVHWSTFLADYDFEIIFRLGALHMKADVMSR
jgi:hypothetical protein